jgi:hypothetical protein
MMAYAILPAVGKARLVSTRTLVCTGHGLPHDICMIRFAYDMGMPYWGLKVRERRSSLGIVPPCTACIPLRVL